MTKKKATGNRWPSWYLEAPDEDGGPENVYEIAGLLAGGLVTFWATGLAWTLLYGLAPDDPLTFAMAVALMTLVALAACIVPARRASGVDPMVALRDE